MSGIPPWYPLRMRVPEPTDRDFLWVVGLVCVPSTIAILLQLSLYPDTPAWSPLEVSGFVVGGVAAVVYIVTVVLLRPLRNRRRD